MLPLNCLEKTKMTSGWFPLHPVTKEFKKDKLGCNEIEFAKDRFKNEDISEVSITFRGAKAI